MRLKICGITNVSQGLAIANLGVKNLGFIYVSSSPRYVSKEVIKEIVSSLNENVKKIGVVVNLSVSEIDQLVTETGLNGIQLHGEETPQFCQEVKQLLPQIELIKALRIKNLDSLQESKIYNHCVDTLLLDAYSPNAHGGTGKTINLDLLTGFTSPLPWLLAGGLNQANIATALTYVKPNGIDLSSSVEISPGNKDLTKVAQILCLIKDLT